jgi:hypothetical protein
VEGTLSVWHVAGQLHRARQLMACLTVCGGNGQEIVEARMPLPASGFALMCLAMLRLASAHSYAAPVASITLPFNAIALPKYPSLIYCEMDATQAGCDARRLTRRNASRAAYRLLELIVINSN